MILAKKKEVNNLSTIKIGNSDIQIKEYKGQRVVTLNDIDVVHNRPDGTARRNFNLNKNRFILNEDYFIVGSDEIRTTHMFPISDNDFKSKTLITEQGYLMLVKSFTDDLAWEVQRKLVNGYFRTRSIVSDELSPHTKLILELAQSIANKELEDKERDRRIELANETAKKAVEATENIKEAVRPVFDNWREEINKKICHIQANTEYTFNELRIEMYCELEKRAGCNLGTRLRNKRQNMERNGCTKTQINKVNKMDIIEDDKKLKEIFAKIVSELEIQHCA